MIENTLVTESSIAAEPREGLTRRPLDWVGALPFVLCHVAVLGAFWSGVTLESVLLCLGLLFARTWGVTAGYHRYFSHRTFKTSRAFQLFGPATSTHRYSAASGTRTSAGSSTRPRPRAGSRSATSRATRSCAS